MTIFIGGAWPYANGRLHLGHAASLLPGDVLARYFRMKGAKVVYVSDSDCYGTPVALRAEKEGVAPEEICERYHADFIKGFQWLGFSYDIYGKTAQEEHRTFVQRFHREMYRGNYVYEKTSAQAYCPACKRFLADRFAVGSCPHCHAPARGDQCDACGALLEPEELKSPACAACGTHLEFRETRHLNLALSRLEGELRAFVSAHPHWRKNAIAFTERYLKEGLRDRAITRDMEWGIPVPRAGFTQKCIYIWAENVLGYLSMSALAAKRQNIDFRELWGRDARHYYVHGKDNIPFHTIILPALLLANGGDWHLPDEIISSEHLTLEGRKLSTSRNWAVWVTDLEGQFEPDSIRYFLLANGPQKRDTDFSFEEYVKSHNGELLGAYGNFIHRTLAFIEKQFDGLVPPGKISQDLSEELTGLYHTVGTQVEQGLFKEALKAVFASVHGANRWFDAQRPWETRATDEAACQNTLFCCVQRIANYALLLEPFLPFSSLSVREWLGLTAQWRPQWVEAGRRLPKITPLFRRLEKSVALEWRQRLAKAGE